MNAAWFHYDPKSPLPISYKPRFMFLFLHVTFSSYTSPDYTAYRVGATSQTQFVIFRTMCSVLDFTVEMPFANLLVNVH
jgi:hypothetical protein